MEAYYKEHKDGPIILEDMELTRIEPVEEDPSRNYYAYIVFFPGQDAGVPMSVEETKTGCLVEWCSFVEGKDQLLEKFFSRYRKEPGTFRALIRRGHYFEKDVPGQDRKVVFDLRSPSDTGPWKIWTDNDSVTYAKYFATGERADWRVSSMMVLTLQWEKDAGGAEYVRLREVVADTWHPAKLPAKN